MMICEQPQKTFDYRMNTLTGLWVIERSDGRYVGSFQNDMETTVKGIVMALNKGIIK